jgi:hypothetical protein
MGSQCCLCQRIPLSSSEFLNQSETWYVGLYHGTIAYVNGILHKSYPPVCLYGYLTVVVKQRLCKNFTMVTNTRESVEEFLDGSFSMLSRSYHKNVGEYLFPERLVFVKFDMNMKPVDTFPSSCV